MIAPTPGDPRGEHVPWRVFVFLGPVLVILVVLSTLVGYSYGKPAGRAHVRDDMARMSRDGVRTPVPTPSTLAPEPFVSSMPRPTMTKLNRTAAPVSVVGPTFYGVGPGKTLSPNVPFSFRVTGTDWVTRTPPPKPDLAFSQAYRKPASGGATSSPLRVMFAWRACGQCANSDVPAFDRRFRQQYDIQPFQLKKKTPKTYYTEVGTTNYYLIVRHLFTAPDGFTYLVDYMTVAPTSDKSRAQQLANEILTQMS